MSDAGETAVIPRVKRIEHGNSTLRVEGPITVAVEGELKSGIDHLTELLDRAVSVDVQHSNDAANADVSVERVEHLPDCDESSESYALGVDEDRVTISAETPAGVHYGATTLTSLVEEHDGKWEIPACEIRDWPDFEWRGFMADPARGHIPLDDLKRLVDRAARAKMNRFHLHLLDAESYALESKAFPELGCDPDGEPRETYSDDDIRELVDYAAARNVEVIPEIDVPSHATHVLEHHPELACTVPDGEASDRTMCIGHDATREFVATLVDEVASLFPSNVIHVGGDEWAMGHSWDDCSVCRERMGVEGSANLYEHFYSFLRDVNDTVGEYDCRTTIWNDEVDISSSPDLPRDILVQFWRVAGQNRGPVEGCSLERFLREGFEVVSSYVHAAYINGWTDEDYLLGWSPTRRPSVPDEYAEQVLGGELLAWEPSSPEAWAYFQRALPSAIPTFADRLWNDAPVDDRDAFARALTRHVLGPAVSDGFDIYDELGGIILPMLDDSPYCNKKAHVGASLQNRTPAEAIASYEHSIGKIDALLNEDDAMDPDAAEAYIDCLEWLIEVSERDGRGIIDWP